MANHNINENPFLANPNAIVDLIKQQANQPSSEIAKEIEKPVVKKKALGAFNGNKVKGARRHG